MLELVNINDHQPADPTVLPIQLFDGIFRPCPLIQQTCSGIPGCRSQIVGFLLTVFVRIYDTGQHVPFFRNPGGSHRPHSLVFFLTVKFHFKGIFTITQMGTKRLQMFFHFGNVTVCMCFLLHPDQILQRTLKLIHCPFIDIFIHCDIIAVDQIFKVINIFQCHKMTIL